MLYGKETVTEITDLNGSREITETNYVKGKPTMPRRRRIENRVKVMNQVQEQEEYARFSDEIKDTKKLDPAFKIEHTTLGDNNGYYYVVGCYTILQY